MTINHDKQDTDFQEVACSHLDALYRHAATLNLSKRDVEDLIEETFLAVSENFSSGSSNQEIKKRLFSTLWNIYREQYVTSEESGERKDPQPGSYETKLDEVPLGVENDSQENFFANLSSEEITQAMDNLPEDYQSCVDLADVENFSYDEIADILNRPRKTVESQLHQGRNIIKKTLVENAITGGLFPSE